MGNEMSHQPYVVRQISQNSGKDEAAIQDFYSAFQKECPSGHMTPEDFSKLYSKVTVCLKDLFSHFPLIRIPNQILELNRCFLPGRHRTSDQRPLELSAKTATLLTSATLSW